MIIDCISDLHGHFPQLSGGDLLIVAGDLTATHTYAEFEQFFIWLNLQKYRKIVFISGNHDTQAMSQFDWGSDNIDYLCDSGTEFVYYPPLNSIPLGTVLERQKLKIWGSPWTLRFPGENPHCLAFTCETEEELAEHWKCIPEDTDILVTHSPIYSLMDETVWGENVGSRSLMDWFLNRKTKNLKLCVCGHIHEAYGQLEHHEVQHVNASHVNERYEPVNKPIRIEL
jgi:Icc-related predicted phosphoesterase